MSVFIFACAFSVIIIDHAKKAVSIATNSLVSITATKMLLTPTRRVGVNIGQKSAIARLATDATTLSVSTTATKALLAPT